MPDVDVMYTIVAEAWRLISLQQLRKLVHTAKRHITTEVALQQDLRSFVQKEHGAHAIRSWLCNNQFVVVLFCFGVFIFNFVFVSFHLTLNYF